VCCGVPLFGAMPRMALPDLSNLCLFFFFSFLFLFFFFSFTLQPFHQTYTRGKPIKVVAQLFISFSNNLKSF
jgi:hypothetical protein